MFEGLSYRDDRGRSGSRGQVGTDKIEALAPVPNGKIQRRPSVAKARVSCSFTRSPT